MGCEWRGTARRGDEWAGAFARKHMTWRWCLEGGILLGGILPGVYDTVPSVPRGDMAGWASGRLAEDALHRARVRWPSGRASFVEGLNS